MSAIAVRIAPARLLLWPVAAATLGLVAIGAGAIAPVPLVALVGLAVLLAVRMQGAALALAAVALIVDNPGERPMDGLWNSPLLAPGRLLYLNLHNLTGIEALRFSLFELLILLLVGIIVMRKVLRDPIDDPLGLGVLPNPMKSAFGVFFAAIVFLEAYGLLRGGDFRNSLWQVRQLFWLPMLGVLFGHALKSPGARLGLLRTLMIAAWVRCAMGIYFYYGVARPAGMRPEYATTHSDSVLTVVAMLIGASSLAERPSRDHILLNLLLQPVLFLGLIVNDRRLAFVSLGAGLALLVLLGPPALIRFLKRSLVVLVPLAMLYVAAGWNSNAAVFRPVSTLRSLTANEDASSQTRDIENYNLIQTLKRHPILGSGFGHEYVELVQANRVDQVFAQYRYIAHNSVIWLLSLAGWVGFAMLWTVFPVGVLIALHVHRESTGAVDRVTAFSAVIAILCFVLQAWGDMGLQSWMGTLIVTALTGATGALFTAKAKEGSHTS